MAIEITEVKRRFRYNGVTLPDVAGLSNQQVRDLYSAQYPELVSAEVEAGEVRDGTQAFVLRKAVGTKGAATRTGSRVAAVRRRALAEAQGLGGTDPTLGRWLQSRRATECARALSDFVDQNLRGAAHEPAADRVHLPSALLAPLP